MVYYSSRIYMKYSCPNCSYIYDEGDGTNILFLCHLPETWKCPVCGTEKALFHRIKREDAAQEFIELQEEEKRTKMVQEALTRDKELRQAIDKQNQLKHEKEEREKLARQQEERKRLKEEEKQRKKLENRWAIASGLLLSEYVIKNSNNKKWCEPYSKKRQK